MLAVNELTGHNAQDDIEPVTDAELNTGLWEYWPMDVVSGDRRGVVNGHTMTNEPGENMPLATIGKLGHAAYSPNSAYAFKCADTAASADWSMVAWVRADGSNANAQRTIFETTKEANGDRVGLSYTKNSGTPAFHWYQYASVDAIGQLNSNTVDLEGGEYRLVALVVESGVLKIWIDGGINAGVTPDFLVVDDSISWEQFSGGIKAIEGNAGGAIFMSCLGVWTRALRPAELLYLWKDGAGRKLHYENIFPTTGGSIIGGVNSFDRERITDGDAVGYPNASQNLDPTKECRLYAPEAWVGWQFPFAIATPQYFKAWRGTQQTNVGSAAVFLEGSLDTANWQTWYQYGHQGPYDTAELAPTSLHPDYPTKYPFWRYRWFGPNEPAGSFISLEELELFV